MGIWVSSIFYLTFLFPLPLEAGALSRCLGLLCLLFFLPPIFDTFQACQELHLPKVSSSKDAKCLRVISLALRAVSEGLPVGLLALSGFRPTASLDLATVHFSRFEALRLAVMLTGMAF